MERTTVESRRIVFLFFSKPMEMCRVPANSEPYVAYVRGPLEDPENRMPERQHLRAGPDIARLEGISPYS